MHWLCWDGSAARCERWSGSSPGGSRGMHRRRLFLPWSSQTWHSSDCSTPAQTGSRARVRWSLGSPSGYKDWRTDRDGHKQTVNREALRWGDLPMCVHRKRRVLHLSEESLWQNSWKRESSAREPDGALLLLAAVAPALLHQAKTSHLPTGGEELSQSHNNTSYGCP